MLVIIRGIPGSGKSTMAKTAKNFVHYEADMFFIDENNNYKYDPDKIKQAHEWCRHSVFFSLKEGSSVAVSNTFIKFLELRPYFEFCLKHKIKIAVVDLFTEYGSIHNVPSHVIYRMKMEFTPLYKIPELFTQVKTYLCYK